MTPTLSVLMPALQSRDWNTLYSVLLEQAEQFPGTVEVLVLPDNGERTSGQKRQLLTEAARGQYLVFVDDDDRVAADYIGRLLRATASGPDVITFNMQFHYVRRPRWWRSRHQPKGEVWKFGLHPDQRTVGCTTANMTANHLCAWRAEIARQVAWCPDLGNGDDQLWYRPLYHSGLAVREVHIDAILYTYLYDCDGTVNQKDDRIQRRRQYMGDSGLRCFCRDVDGRDTIVIEVGDKHLRTDAPGFVRVRDNRNQVLDLPLAELRLFHTIESVK